MRLSEKGIETIFSALLKTIEERDLAFGQISKGVFKKHVEALEFESDDFDGCCQNGNDHLVCLTVEEAKMLEDMALRWMFLNPKNVTLKSAQLMKQLCQQIGQAERKE